MSVISHVRLCHALIRSGAHFSWRGMAVYSLRQLACHLQHSSVYANNPPILPASSHGVHLIRLCRVSLPRRTDVLLDWGSTCSAVTSS